MSDKEPKRGTPAYYRALDKSIREGEQIAKKEAALVEVYRRAIEGLPPDPRWGAEKRGIYENTVEEFEAYKKGWRIGSILLIVFLPVRIFLWFAKNIHEIMIAAFILVSGFFIALLGYLALVVLLGG